MQWAEPTLAERDPVLAQVAGAGGSCAGWTRRAPGHRRAPRKAARPGRHPTVQPTLMPSSLASTLSRRPAGIQRGSHSSPAQRPILGRGSPGARATGTGGWGAAARAAGPALESGANQAGGQGPGRIAARFRGRCRERQGVDAAAAVALRARAPGARQPVPQDDVPQLLCVPVRARAGRARLGVQRPAGAVLPRSLGPPPHSLPSC
jgi:hypothetical protein